MVRVHPVVLYALNPFVVLCALTPWSFTHSPRLVVLCPPSREDGAPPRGSAAIVGLPAGEDSLAIAHIRISTDSLWSPAGEDILEPPPAQGYPRTPYQFPLGG